MRVRFAPSPTGYLHIGGVRTALFNWLLARRHQGTFILRIEDTDRSRSTEEAVQEIVDGLHWLGLDWDEGPYRQTDRLTLYRTYVNRLLDEGKAYRCYCLPEELEARRAEALRRGETPKYDGRCRGLSAPLSGRPFAVRFQAQESGQTVVEDLLRGRVTFDNAQLDDLILLRSDEFPTYNLAAVVDDIEMRITHVVRGDDHLNNTPRQLQLYTAFGQPPPQFAHVPMILGPDRARLSKRHGATATLAYRQMGYLPEAMVNYLVRLGWSYGDQEIFRRDELIARFSLEAVGRSPAVFNPEKLRWLNAHYVKTADHTSLSLLVWPFLEREGLVHREQPLDQDWLAGVVRSLQPRSNTLADMARDAAVFFAEEVDTIPEVRQTVLTPAARTLLEGVLAVLEAVEPFTQATLEPAVRQYADRAGCKLGAVAQPLRVAVTGKTVSASLFEVLALIGKPRVLRRVRHAIDALAT